MATKLKKILKTENLLTKNHKAYSYQIWHVALRNGSLEIIALGSNLTPRWEVTSFTWDYIWKILEFSLYVAMRSRFIKYCMWLYLVGLYQECPNYSPGSNLASPQGH